MTMALSKACFCVIMRAASTTELGRSSMHRPSATSAFKLLRGAAEVRHLRNTSDCTSETPQTRLSSGTSDVTRGWELLFHWLEFRVRTPAVHDERGRKPYFATAPAHV
jgi:hypothetical protein